MYTIDYEVNDRPDQLLYTCLIPSHKPQKRGPKSCQNLPILIN